jgi:hypothetical protein
MVTHAQAGNPDGSRAGCLWSWYVRRSALAHLGIEPPPDPAV